MSTPPLPPPNSFVAVPCANRHWPLVLSLLSEVYVGEGYVGAERAAENFRRDKLEAGGTVLTVVTGEVVLGVVILLHGESPMKQVAQEGEAEFRMLAVDPRGRGLGIGELLVAECVRRAALPPLSAQRLVLWTQPRMLAAQRLYGRMGFRRATERDSLLPPLAAGPGGVVLERWAYCLEL